MCVVPLVVRNPSMFMYHSYFASQGIVSTAENFTIKQIAVNKINSSIPLYKNDT